jgi:hypothetical protein
MSRTPGQPYSEGEIQGLMQFCYTDRQREILEAILANGCSLSATSRAINLDIRTMQRTLDRIKVKGARQGVSPSHDMTKPCPDGFTVKGTSTLYDAEGNVSIQWVKTQADRESQLQALTESLTDVFEEYKGKSVPVKPPKTAEKDILTVYPMGDPHIGMYAWAEECGEDFDCGIASKNLCAAVDNLVERSRPSHTAVILNLGDFFHSDGLGNTTTKGTAVDMDTRWNRVLRIGVQTLIQCVYSALKKHKKVVVKNVCGNHDRETANVLSVALSCYFDGNKRVEVDDSAYPFWYYQFGKVLLGSTHGDMAKPDSLPAIMSADKSKEWGETEFRYWLTGHIHSMNAKEYPGCTWESFRTLAAKDAWHTASGYRSGRDMKSIAYHKDYGEIERHTMNIAMLRTSKG